MSRIPAFFLTTAIALTGTVASAQVFDAQDRADARIDDLEESIDDAADRDVPVFGNEGRELGFTGSVALQATAADRADGSDSVDLGLGTRLGFFDGTNGVDVNLSYDYGEDNGTETANALLAGANYTREFGSSFYGFGKVDVAYDEFSSFESDTFLGFGVGYRIVDNGDVSWAVQAGPGYRYLKDNNGVETDEEAISLTSFYSNDLTETVFITNDTDVLFSDLNTLVTNEFGVNVAMSNALALRTSLTTKYNSDPLPGFEEYDNSLGVSVVYSFN